MNSCSVGDNEIVSYETLNEYGSKIGYQVRFEKNKSSNTRVLFLTEVHSKFLLSQTCNDTERNYFQGLLLRQYAADNMLSMYDVIVVDEVHERHMMGRISFCSLIDHIF